MSNKTKGMLFLMPMIITTMVVIASDIGWTFLFVVLESILIIGCAVYGLILISDE